MTMRFINRFICLLKDKTCFYPHLLSNNFTTFGNKSLLLGLMQNVISIDILLLKSHTAYE